MQVSIIRQTPAASVMLMLLLVTIAFVRFALAPYGDELITGGVATLGELVDRLQSTYPVWGWILSGLTIFISAFNIGKTTSSLGLYPQRTTITIPLFAIISCGIFIATDSLAVSIATLLSVQTMRYLCGGYVRGTDLNFALYAGLCAGIAPLFYAPTTTLLLLLPVAIMMFGLSWREIIVMIVGAIFPLAATCYVDWLCGDEFATPAISLYEAFTGNYEYTLWSSESVVALTLMGIILFATICGIIAFFGDRRSVAVRPRTILAFNIVFLAITLVSFSLPSATVGLFSIVAIPASVLIPVGLVHARDLFANLLFMTIIVLMFVHLFIA